MYNPDIPIKRIYPTLESITNAHHRSTQTSSVDSSSRSVIEQSTSPSQPRSQRWTSCLLIPCNLHFVCCEGCGRVEGRKGGLLGWPIVHFENAWCDTIELFDVRPIFCTFETIQVFTELLLLVAQLGVVHTNLGVYINPLTYLYNCT